MDKNTIVTIVLIVLVLISVVQAFQLSVLKNNVADAGAKLSMSSGKVASQSGGGGSGGSAPSSLNELPQMVGGC